MFRETISFLVVIGLVTNVYVLWNQRSSVGIQSGDWVKDFRPPPMVKNSCPEHFTQSHFMTIDDNIGRLGNNLFRLLALIGTARKYCYTPVLNKNKFNLLNNAFDLSFISDISRTDYHWKIMKTDPCYIYPNTLNSLNTTCNWTLKGYMQSWRYMHGHEEYIRSVIKFRQNITRNASDYIQSIGERNKFGKNGITICVHVRRGDFIKGADFGYTVSNVSYFNKSFAYYNNKLGKDKLNFIMLSDDMDWVKANIKGRHVYYSEGMTAAVDMAIMSLCNHSIITTGSFGYLGAWLNGGSVVYDSKFPRPGSPIAAAFNRSDYYPENWLGM